MINIYISDMTLREEAKRADMRLSFKEKIELARQLDRLGVDVIETAPITNGKTDILYLHTIAPVVKNSVISCPVAMNEKDIEIAWDAIKGAAKPRLDLMIPVSTVQMEYLCHAKPNKIMEQAEALVKKATELCEDVEVSLLDATRAETGFLYEIIAQAINNGAKTVTLCDSAGAMLPIEFEAFVKDILENVPSASSVTLSAECSDELNMATATAISCIHAGVTQIKTDMITKTGPSLSAIAKTFKAKADALGINTGLNMTLLENSIKSISGAGGEADVFTAASSDSLDSDFTITADDDINTVCLAIEKMGFDLSEEDIKRVYDEVAKTSAKKKVTSRELDAIIASVSMQVAPTYKLKNYVVNTGNLISTTAQIELEYNGESKHGVCIGDGPIDGAIRAIEQITGHHYELDDFQIHSVTEGREAMATTIVKLRSGGSLYSGKGISTNIVSSGIKAYINALNKICFEETE